MKRRDVLLAAGATLAAGCSTSGGSDPGAKRREIDTAVDTALSDLYTAKPATRELVTRARGVLVFPNVVSAGFVIGGSYGQGALREGGKTTGYYSVGAGSVGLLAGAQTKAMYLLFMTQDGLTKFKSSESGWTAGADASVAVADMGADAQIDTRTANAPVIGVVRSKEGLMANLSLDGTKVSKLQL